MKLILGLFLSLNLIAQVPFPGGGGGGGGSSLTQIAKTILGSPAANITFTSIPGTYNNLVLKIQAASDQATQFENVNIVFNADAGTNYNFQSMTGVGTTAPASFSGTAGTSLAVSTIPGTTSPANSFGIVEIHIFNYASTSFWKSCTFLAGQNRAGTAVAMQSYIGWGEWQSTAVITSIKFAPSAGNLITGSTAILYGEN